MNPSRTSRTSRPPRPAPRTAAAPAAGWTSWLPWPLLTALAAGLGTWASADALRFYALLDKPAWAPPASLFGPVWTVLYLLMAVAAAWVARTPAPPRRAALAAFGLQLALNALWSWCFFAWHQGALAMAVLAVLWLLLLACAALFWRVQPLAAALMLPVIAWVAFAGVLNLAVWLRNPALLG
ncbi:MAG: TspO/MBR family protein [Rubrivivax sp.]